MTTPEKGQLITANRLRDGIAVFMTRAGDWSELIDDAVLAQEPQAAAALETRAKEDEKNAAARADEAKAMILMKARAKLELMNTSQEKASVNCGEHKMSISTVADNPGKEITADMVGTITGKRSGYTTVRIT